MNEIKNGEKQIIKSVKLSEIFNTIETPSFQRNIDTDRVNQIRDKLIEKKKFYNNYPYEGLITIVSLSNKLYCIDGQHRLNAYNLLLEKDSDITILIDFRLCSSFEELRDLYKDINKSIKVPDYLLYEENEVSRNIIKDGVFNFKKQYNCYFRQTQKSKARSYRPKLRENELCDAIFHSEYKYSNAKELTEYLIKINQKLCSLTLNQIYILLDKFKELKRTDSFKTINNLIDKNINNDNPCYLGLFVNLTFIKNKADFENELFNIN